MAMLSIRWIGHIRILGIGLNLFYAGWYTLLGLNSIDFKFIPAIEGLKQILNSNLDTKRWFSEATVAGIADNLLIINPSSPKS